MLTFSATDGALFHEMEMLRRLAAVMCQKYGFGLEMHRYLACEPHEVAAGADYWLSPYTIGRAWQGRSAALL